MNFSSNALLDWLIEQKFDITFSDGSQNIYNAVHAMAHALHETNLQQVDNQAIDNGKLSRYPCFKVEFLLLDDVWCLQLHSHLVSLRCPDLKK